MLGGHHEEGRSEEGVGAGREDGIVDVQFLAPEGDLGALAAADPVALHRLDVLGPVDPVEVAEQPLGVVGDPQQPLLELADLDHGPAALAVPVGAHLLVGEHGLVVGAPLDGRLAAVREPGPEQLQEDPLGPAVVGGFAGGELPGPVDRDPPGSELLLKGGDRLGRRDTWVDARADRVVLGRQPERVVAHRVQHPCAATAAVVGDGVPQRVALQVADVGLPTRVGGASRARTCRARRDRELRSRPRFGDASRGPRRGRGWPPPRCARAPTAPASGARSRAGRSGAPAWGDRTLSPA